MKHRERYKSVQFAPLRSFCMVATLGSFSDTAKALQLSPPTVWQQVRALERLLQARLVERQGRKIGITDEGRLLLQLIEPHVVGINSLCRLWETRRAELPQRLTVAAPPYLVSHHLLESVQRFMADHPAVFLNLRVVVAGEVPSVVERGEVDLGVTMFDPNEPLPRSLDFEVLCRLHFVVMTAAGHPLMKKKHIALADVLQYPMILPPRDEFNDRTLRRLLNAERWEGEIRGVMETRNVDIIARYVAAGIGVNLAYVSLKLASKLPGIAVRVFNPAVPTQPVALVKRKHARLPLPASHFEQLLRTLLSEADD